MSRLKVKAVNGALWNFTESIVGQGFTFFVGIVLARLLSPAEIGQISLIIVFITFSQVFVNSGFSSALIRKQDCTQDDYSTVFYYNLIVGLLLYCLLFLFSNSIGKLLNDHQMPLLIKTLGLILIIDSLAMIHRTKVVKEINFKLQARISIFSYVLSGGIAIVLAFFNFGVWSLVAQRLIKQFSDSVLYWILNRWKPEWNFSVRSFKQLFGFGGKLLVSNLIDSIFQNVNYFVIGKYFSVNDLGLYYKADEFKKLPSQNIYAVISKVSYPVLAELQNDNDLLKHYYKRLIKSTMFVTFLLMFGLIAISDSLVIVLLGEKWIQVIPFLKLMCLSGMLYPLHALNLNLLQVKGRSDLFLKLEVIKKMLVIPSIVLGVIYGIKVMLILMIVNSLIAYYLNSYWSGKLIHYPIVEQIKDIIPSLSVSIVFSGIIYLIFFLLNMNSLAVLLIQLFSFLALVITYSETTKLDEYQYFKNMIAGVINRFFV